MVYLSSKRRYYSVCGLEPDAQNLQLVWISVLRPFLAIFSPTTWIIFRKTEVQTVILRYWTSYDTNELFFQNRKKWETEILTYCAITLEPIRFLTCSSLQNDRLNFRFVKDIHVWFAKIWLEPFIGRKFWTSGFITVWHKQNAGGLMHHSQMYMTSYLRKSWFRHNFDRFWEIH